MGCGQSKINLYPRRNKSSSKANGSKKSGTSETKDTDEEDGAAGSDHSNHSTSEETKSNEADDRQRDLLPLVSNVNHLEPSPSQQDFFKMLDEKILQGRDYDSTSETEIEREYRRQEHLLQQWNAASHASRFSVPSPPTPARKRLPQSSKSLEKNSPSSRRCLKTQQSVITDLPTPPYRRCASADQYINGPKQQISSGKEWHHEATGTPVRRSQNSSWKNTTKVTPHNQVALEKTFPDSEEDMVVTIMSEKTIKHDHDNTYMSRDTSQITYNPTFQTHSPAHQRAATASPQPYIAQIVTYPKSQHVSQSFPAYISPPETYQDPPTKEKPNKPSTSQSSMILSETGNNYERQDCINSVQPPTLKTQMKSQSAQNLTNSNLNTNSNSSPNIYYIHGNPQQEKIMAQRQQTAIHLQQYVAMKQAQQNMFGYLQRMPHTIYPNPEYLPVQQPQTQQLEQSKVYETVEDTYGTSYYPGLQMKNRPHTAPNAPNSNANLQRQTCISPVISPLYQITPVVNQIPFIGNIPAPITNYGQYSNSQFQQGEYKYYHHTQMTKNAYRPGSAGTLTRYQKHTVSNQDQNNLVNNDLNRQNVCQSMNIVRQKSVGQIVPMGDSLGVYKTVNANDDSVPTEANVCAVRPMIKSTDCQIRHNSADKISKSKSSQNKSDANDRDAKSSSSSDKQCKKKTFKSLKKSKSGEFSSK